jgi:hypothetical protein
LRSLAAWRQAEHARRSAEDETAMLDVGDTALYGTVEYAQDHDYAVRATVEQVGSEAEISGSWTVSWTETKRSFEVAPFYVVHASRSRVRVDLQGRINLEADLVANVRRQDVPPARRTAPAVRAGLGDGCPRSRGRPGVARELP